MNGKEALRAVMKETRTTQERLAHLVGCKSQRAISERLHKQDIKIGMMVEMLESMGYELVVQPKTSGKRKIGQIVLTIGKENEK